MDAGECEDRKVPIWDEWERKLARWETEIESIRDELDCTVELLSTYSLYYNHY